MQGSHSGSTITIRRLNGFDGMVSFTVHGLPNGVRAAFSLNPATSTSSLTLTASGTALEGTKKVAVAGTSGSLAQTTLLTLTVTGAKVALSPTSLNFGNEVESHTSAAKTVTVKNTGTATLDISKITISADFAISSHNCGSTLAVGKTCTVSVTFTPTKLGRVTGMLSFTDNASGSPQKVKLSGTGIS